MGEADGIAELLEAEALGADEDGHDQSLWAGEVAAGELGLEALTHAALDDVELAFGLLRELTKFSGRVIVFGSRVLRLRDVLDFFLESLAPFLRAWRKRNWKRNEA